MAKEIRTRQVCKDIKALDKAKAATGHMKHAYVRIRERAGNAQMQGQESETPADYAESKMEHGADRVIHEAVRPIRQQGRKRVKQGKEIRQTAETIKQGRQENGEGHTSGKEPCPSFSSAQEGKFYQTKSQEAKNKNAQAGKQPLQRRHHRGKPYSRRGSGKHRNKPYGERASQKLCSVQVNREFQKLAEPKCGNCPSRPLRRWNTGKRPSRQIIILGGQ